MTGLEVGLAIPGLIDLTIKSAKTISDRISTFKHADEVLGRLRTSIFSLKEGHLNLGLEALRLTCRNRTTLGPFEPSLRNAFNEIVHCLRDIQTGLDHISTDHVIGKIHYSFTNGNGSHRQLSRLANGLRNACADLTTCCLQIQITKTLQSSHCLTPANFVISHEQPGLTPVEYLPKSDIRTVKGTYKDSKRRATGRFILEGTSEHLEESVHRVQSLCTKLAKGNTDGLQGIRPLLGYREFHGTLQLIFELQPGG